MSRFTWGTVTAVSPLRVQLDGDPAALPLVPGSLVDPVTLTVGNRVRCELTDSRRVVVVGVSGGPDPQWSTWTPTWTNLTIGNGTWAGRFVVDRGVLHCYGRFTFGSTTTVTGVFHPSMPVPLTSQGTQVSPAWAFDSSAVQWRAGAFTPSNYFLFDTGRAAAAAPFVWATGDIVQFSMTAEAA